MLSWLMCRLDSVTLWRDTRPHNWCLDDTVGADAVPAGDVKNDPLIPISTLNKAGMP
jgi:hypothetical protein